MLCAVACGHAPDKQAATEPVAACSRDDDCPRGRCDPFAGCVGCLFDSDCGVGARCVEQACHSVTACAKDEDCESGNCDTGAGRCAECRADADCRKSERCADAVCVKVARCEMDMDCATGQRCDRAERRCAGCLSDDDCSGGAVCSGGKCASRCKSNNDCPEIYHCAKKVCALDVCEAGRSSCSSSAGATLSCSEAGDSFDLSPCGAGRSCAVRDGLAECQKSLCAPGRWGCDEGHETAELCSADGLEVAERVECALDGRVCDDGKCVAKLCEPGVARCDGSAVATCNASGSGEDTKACGAGERCDAAMAQCVAQVCQPGSAGCLAETVATCNDEGSGFEATGDDCAASELACWEGACKAVVCTAGFSCLTGNSYECAANRTALVLAKNCSFAGGKFCSADSGQCQDFVCAPGQPTCNGDLATSCASDGSRALDVGVDCTAANQVCWAAECLSPICTPDSYACDGALLRRCINRGTAFELSKTCGPGTVCDARAGTCRLQKCAPDLPACDGSLATTCDGTGLGYTGPAEDCSASGKVCVAGACKPIICAPNASYCESNELRKCGPNGGSFELVDACQSAEYCDAARGACVPDACTPGSAVCSGNALGNCNDEGSGPKPGGTDCGSQVCDRGACRSVVCVPQARFCKSGNVALCNAVGTDSAPYDDCAAREFCDGETTGAAACAADVCPQGGSACSGEHLATCNSDGSDVTSVGVDCSLSSQVCDLGGACLTQAFDDLGGGGAAVPFASSAIHFNLLRVSTTRKVVEFRAGSAPASSPLTWVVYRAAKALGTFSRVDEFSTPTVSSGGYSTSGALRLTLESDAYYLIGLAVSGAHDISVLEGGAPVPFSFGVRLGGFSYTAGLPPTIPDTVEVGPGLVGDAMALRLYSTLP